MRGVVEFELGGLEPLERVTIEERLPRLAGRLAAELPRLGIRSWRLIDPRGFRSPSQALIAADEQTPSAAPRASAIRPEAPERAPAGPWIQRRRETETSDDARARLSRLMERYLARGADQKP